MIARRLALAASLCGALVGATGCSTLSDAQAARGSGTVRIYAKPYDVVWAAMVASVRETSLAVVSENKAQGLLLAQGAVGAFSWGENVAVYVEPAGDRAKTRVEVINKLAVATNITAADWERRLTAAMERRLGVAPR